MHAQRKKISMSNSGSATSAAASPSSQSTPSAELDVRGYKKHMCWHWEQGKCTKGINCTYAHGAEELEGYGSGKGGGKNPAVERWNYKRALCDYFAQGRCEKGEECTFAHGVADLRDSREKGPAPVHHGP